MADGMTRIERFVYDRVKDNRRLKTFLRNTLQSLCDGLGPRPSASAYRIDSREGFFFGFHDKCPWSIDNTNLLAHRFEFDLRPVEAGDQVEVGYFDSPLLGEFVPVGRTCTWNWHQGAMLQWLGNSSRIIFNDLSHGRHVARIVDLGEEPARTLPGPVAAVTPDGTKALSYSFARLRASPYGYGYAHGEDPDEGVLLPERSGLDVIDVVAAKQTTIITLSEIARIRPEPSMRGALHYVSHCQFSPSGSRFFVFHLWLYGSNRLGSRMLTCSIEGSRPHVLPTAGMVSHATWRDDESILAYARAQPHGDRYYLWRDQSDEFHPVGEDQLISDGHPSFSPDKRWILTDTYPDRFRRRRLLLFDVDSNRCYTLARLHSPREYSAGNLDGMLRCDLHPRWDRPGTKICFDSTHGGRRALCVMEIGDLGGGVEPRSLATTGPPRCRSSSG